MTQNNTIYQLAKLLSEKKGSDIIINADALVAVKIDGKVRYLKDTLMTGEQTEQLAHSLLTDKQWTMFEETAELNFMLKFPDIAYFRTNVFRQRGNVGMVLRLIPLKVPTLEELELPEIFKEIALKKRGLVLFSGATGTGKSTSLAAMLSYRNQMYAEHIITVEDPIEFVHENKKSVITQREVGSDTVSYAAALKSALRQAPDAILVGEIRDAEVMESALTFAETGHMVYATVHATNAMLTLERAINLFPLEQRETLLQDLASNLQTIVTQRLVERSDKKGRIAILEIMTKTPHIEQLIRDNRLDDLNEAMRRSSLKDGVINMDNYIFDVYESGKINYETAVQYADSPHDFAIRLRTESNRPLPHELSSENEQNWDVEEAVSAEKNQKLWGGFQK